MSASFTNNIASPINAMASAVGAAAAAFSSSLMTTVRSSPSTSSLISDESNNQSNPEALRTFKIEKKHFERVYKLIDKIIRYCQSERMNLINSPPYILDILPDINQTFVSIYTAYENKLHLLSDNDYFCIMIANCTEKFDYVVDLFKTAGKRIYDETSAERHSLTKMTLIFSHMLADMKSIFPKGVYEGQSFRIAKKDATEFWLNNFGKRVIVTWQEFERKLNQVHPINNDYESAQLRKTIQLTETKYVSIFEFDVFIRLFQPWFNLLYNWKCLALIHPGHCAFITYDEVHKRLEKHINKPGSYLFRLSCTKLGQWAIGYVTNDKKILQTIPQSLVQALIDGQKHGVYLYPNGRDVNIDLSGTLLANNVSKITISKEEFDTYSKVGTSFQLCKICAENDKDRKIEPCGHLICSKCLQAWQEKNADPGCPFCRYPIKSFEPIEIVASTTISLGHETRSNDSADSKSDQCVESKASYKNSRSSSNSSSSSASCKQFLNRNHSELIVENNSSETVKNLNDLTNTLTSTMVQLQSTPLPPPPPPPLSALLTNKRNSTHQLELTQVTDENCQPPKANKCNNHNGHIINESSPQIPQRNKHSLVNNVKTMFESTNPENKYNVEQLLANETTPSTTTTTDDDKNSLNLAIPTSTSSSSASSSSSSSSSASASASVTSFSASSASSKSSIPQLPLPNTPTQQHPPPIPPPPLSSTVYNMSTSFNKPTIVTPLVDKSNLVKIKIDNEIQFEILLNKLSESCFVNGANELNRIKLACALVLADNDSRSAEEIILQSSNNNHHLNQSHLHHHQQNQFKKANKH